MQGFWCVRQDWGDRKQSKNRPSLNQKIWQLEVNKNNNKKNKKKKNKDNNSINKVVAVVVVTRTHTHTLAVTQAEEEGDIVMGRAADFLAGGEEEEAA